jgi:hypothetical protein
MFDDTTMADGGGAVSSDDLYEKWRHMVAHDATKTTI